MSARGDPYDYDDPPRRHRHHHRDDREPRYVETEETYVRAPAGSAAKVAQDAPYPSRTTDLVRQPARQDSDMSIEEVRRDFPPPGYGSRSLVPGRDDRYGPPSRARSAERGSQYGGYDDRRSYYDSDDRRSRKSATYIEKEVKPRRRSLSRNQKIIAGVAGAALAVGGKELWDRRQADGRPMQRNVLATAAVGAAGAFAGYEATELYAKHANKAEKEKTYVAHQGRNGEVAEYYSSGSEEEKPKKSRRKSIVEGALGLAGLGAAAGAAKGSSSRDRSKSRSGRGRSPEGPAKFQQAAKAALLAGATEAFRVRKEPGGWGGAKGKRILTAAIGAGGIDAAADRNPDHKSKRHILEAVVGGLAGNRLINGSRNNVAEDDRRSRSRSRARSQSRARSRSRGGDGGGGGGAGLAALATAGLGALAGKKFLDNDRERSRDGGRDDDRRRRRGSPDSYDSRSPSPRRDKHKRSKSVTDRLRGGLASLGIGGAAAEEEQSRHRSDRDRDVVEEETTVQRRRHRHGSDEDRDRDRDRRRRDDSEDDYDRPRRSRGDAYGDPSRRGGGRGDSAREQDGKKNRRIAEGKEKDGSDSDSSLGSSSGDEKRIKKMKGKQLLTAGLATVATIHAAHNIYQSMEKREARHKAVQEGEMSPEEARKLKTKATLQDAASVGIAALGIKGAISEIKEANQMRHECRELREQKEERHKKRMERQKKLSQGGGRSDNSRTPRGRIEYDAPPYNPAPRYSNGPRYTDGNPYAQPLPAPPVGYSGR